MEENNKQIRMTFSNGQIWSIPVFIVAENRTQYYAAKEGFKPSSERYRKEFEFILNDDSEAIDWLENNMDWDDIKHVAGLIEDGQVDFTHELCNSEKEIINS